MNSKAIKTIGVIGSLYNIVHLTNQAMQKNRGLSLAMSLSADKGIINLGAGCSRVGFAEAVCELPEVVTNIDLSGDCNKCIVVNLEDTPLPFTDKQFDVAFASHVLEHLVNWEQALNEWTRIANYTIIVLPNPLSITGRLYWEHKQHFSFSDMNYMREHWSNVEIFS